MDGALIRAGYSNCIDDPSTWEGIFGITPNPDYATTGYIYVPYSRSDLTSVFTRSTRKSTNPDQADPASEAIFLTISYPRSGHRSGRLAFGPDGYLYITTGDSSSGARGPVREADQQAQQLAQNLTDLHEKILRLDDAGVDHNGGLSVSITGGFVYRGSAHPALKGWYIYADYARGTYWTLKPHPDGSVENIAQLVSTATAPVSFGKGADGELYVLSLGDGKLYQVGSVRTDLSLMLCVRPSTLVGTQAISMVGDVVELNSVPTTGSFSVRISKDTHLSLRFGPSATTVGQTGQQPGLAVEWSRPGLLHADNQSTDGRR